MNEQEFGTLFDEKAITKARKEAEHKYRDISSIQLDSLRRKCKNDLFFLAQALGYTRLTPRLHGDYTSWLTKWRGYQYKLSLLPRGHYKSTCDTIVDSVQMVLPNVADVKEHPYCLGPNATILLAHEVREKASGFLFEITAAFTRNPLILTLFDECIPLKNEQRINKWELELPRDDHHKEATFSTVGVGGAAQGGHYHWLKLDDLIGEEARDSDTVMGRILDWFDNILALAVNAEDGFNLTGTRWAYSDVYSHAMQTYGISRDGSVLNCLPDQEVEKHAGGLLKVYARGVFENGVPIFPELMTESRIKILRQNRLIWAAQYANNPMESGLNEFYWPLKFYNTALNDPQKIVVFTGDSSFSRYLRDLDVCIFVDPSMAESKTADEVGVIVTGVDHRGNIFLLETVKERIDPTKFMDQLYRLNYKYRPRVVAIEEVVFSAIFRHWIQDRERLTGVYLPIRAFKPGTKKSKVARIRGLTHYFSAGQIYIHENMISFRDEYEQFPMSKSEHLLDALAQGPEFWQKGNSVYEVDQIRKLEKQIIDNRDIATGY
jgi:predicted phage terminase large subunit-like protein